MTEFPYLPEYDEATIDTICRGFGARLLILFGSRATGSPPPTPESDLDMAVLFTETQVLKVFLRLSDLGAYPWISRKGSRRALDCETSLFTTTTT